MDVNSLTGTDITAFNNVGGGILQFLAMLGSGLSIIFLICLGIKYMIGSIEEKAEYKKTMMPYFIGALLVFGASTIAQVLYSIFNK